MPSPEHPLRHVGDRAGKLIFVVLAVISPFEMIEEIYIEGLEDPTHIGRQDEDNNAPCPAGLEEVDFDMGIMSIEEEEAAASGRDLVSSRGVKRLLQPLHGDEGVGPARVGVGGELWDPWLALCRPCRLQGRPSIDHEGRDRGGLYANASDDCNVLIGRGEGLAIAGMGLGRYFPLPALERQLKTDLIHVIHAGGGVEAGVERLLHLCDRQLPLVPSKSD